jgi:hypothetical protein
MTCRRRAAAGAARHAGRPAAPAPHRRARRAPRRARQQPVPAGCARALGGTRVGLMRAVRRAHGSACARRWNGAAPPPRRAARAARTHQTVPDLRDTRQPPGERPAGCRGWFQLSSPNPRVPKPDFSIRLRGKCYVLSVIEIRL